MGKLHFLDYGEVLEIHESRLAIYGGTEGIRDQEVIHSALAQPQWTATYGGDIAEIAGSYLYHFAINQGFLDGNKRTAVACCDTFLMLNGYELTCSAKELYGIAMRAANKELDKDEIAEWIRNHLNATEPDQF